jgi:hypothetical protein
MLFKAGSDLPEVDKAKIIDSVFKSVVEPRLNYK